jgi:predicted dienelactone hydrolase
MLLLAAGGCGGGSLRTASSPVAAPSAQAATPAGSVTAPSATAPPRGAPYAVGLRVLHLLDRSRTIALPDGARVPRPLLTYVRYPVAAPPGERDLPGASPDRAGAPYPLIVFGHGYAVTPAIYARLLRAWTRAGFVVAAPVFPLGNARAPGGPDEPDLVNQPADMSFVVTRLLAPGGPLAGLADPSRVALAGQSDGGDSALAATYDARVRDPRVRAAVILSGAEIPYLSPLRFPAHGPPLLATQGTADTINPPALTEAFFGAAPRPKFLLWLTGAEHLPPYTQASTQLGIVERLSIAFLDRYLHVRPVSQARLRALGSVPGEASIEAFP